MKKSIFSLMLFIAAIPLFSQAQNRIIDEINNKQGLQSLSINTIFQDRKGFIWISTTWMQSYSLQRYDGYEFVDYDHIPRAVNHMAEDRRGLLWFCTGDGFYVMDPETENLTQYIPYHTYSSNGVREIYEDTNGNIWCAASYGLYKMVPKTNDEEELKDLILEQGIDAAFDISVFRLNEADTSEVGSIMYDIYEDSRQRIWVSGRPGLFIYDDATNEFIRLDDDASGNSRLNNTIIVTIVEENPDVFWLHISGGFTRISNVSSLFKETLIDKTSLDFEYYSPDFRTHTFLEDFLIDSQSNLWFGTPYNGLIKMNIDDKYEAIFEEAYPEMTDPKGNLFEYVTHLMIDHTGLLWAGHESGRIKKIREAGTLFTPLEETLKEDPPLKYSFNNFYEDSEGNLWVCNYASGIYKIGADGKVSNYKISDPAIKDQTGNDAVALLEINKDIFWIGALYGVWQLDTRTGKSQRLFTESVNNLVYDFIRIEDYIVIRSYGQGFWIYNMKTDQLDHHTADQKDSLGLKSNTITSFDKMRNGEIWIGTGNQGLTRMSLNTATGEVNFLPLPEAISMNTQTIIIESRWINNIHEDRTGVIWFGTGNGLIRLNVESGETQQWNQKDGLCSDNIVSIEEDNDGNLWLAGSDGVTMLDVSTGVIRTFDERDGLPKVRNMHSISYKDSKGLIYFGGFGGFYRIDPDNIFRNDQVPPVAITDFRIFNKSVKIDSTRKASLTKNISYTQEIDLKYNQNDLSFTFAALDYNDPSKNRYAYIMEGYQEEWIETDANNRTASYTNLRPGEYTFRVKGSNNDGVWNEEGAFISIIIHPPFWKTTFAYIVYAVLVLLIIRGYIFWRTQQLRKEKIVLETQVTERTQQIELQKEELKTTNIQLKKNQEELQEVNTQLEEQKEELMQQKEELQSTLENLQKTQEQLIESEKMAAVGGLVAGVAHEINTPVGVGITAISNLLDDIQKMAGLFEKDEISRSDFKEFLQSTREVSTLIQKNLERTAALVQSFKQVSADQVTEQQRVFGLKDYLNDILMSLQPKFRGRKIDTRIECDDKLELNSYPGIYAQIFTNLILNSLQHGYHKRKSGSITMKADVDKDSLKIRYSDDGEGISKKDLPHIFEPFYTTDQRRSTGLGLNIIYNLVRQKLHGTITCESEAGEGVLFEIKVPV